MADDLNSSDNTDLDLDQAASAITDLLNRQQPDDAPAQTDVPQSQPSAPAQASEVETPASEARQEPAPDNTAPEVPEEPSQPAHAAAPDVEQMRSEAARKIQEAEATRNQFLNALNTYVPQLEAAIRGEFADIKGFDDLQRVAQEDPDRYNRYVIANARLQQAQQAQQTAQGQANQQAQQRHAEWQASERTKLEKFLPDLKDPEKGPALAKKLQDFAIKERGYTPQQLAMASANDFALLHDAMQFKASQAALKTAQAKAAKAPPVQQPGTVTQSSSKDEKLKGDFERLQKTGSIDDAARVFQSMF
jgi:hypothetical protein